MTREKAVIKKYGDRRLYHSSARQYVKLDDIARMIREGMDVEVRDARTDKDITRVILTQIIVEDARDDKAGLPLKLLHQLVVASDRATHDFLSWYLETAFELYQKAGAAIRSRVSEARSVVTSPVDFVRHLLSGETQAPGDSEEIEQLRRRVQELEARLAQSARRAPRKKAAASKREDRPAKRPEA